MRTTGTFLLIANINIGEGTGKHNANIRWCLIEGRGIAEGLNSVVELNSWSFAQG